MEIVLALHQFPPLASGGTEQLVRWTALGLQDLGHRVRIVAAVPRRQGAAVEVPAGYLDPDGLGVQFLRPRSATAGMAEGIVREYDDQEAGAQFARILDDAKPDAIHFFHLAGLTSSALRAAAARHLPFVFTATDFWLECPTVQLLLQDNALCAGPQADRMNCARHLAGIRWPAARRFASVAMVDRPAAAAIELLAGVRPSSGASRSLRALQSRSDTLRRALEPAAAVIAPNAFMQARLLAFGIAPDKVRLQPYGVPGADADATPGARAGAARRPRAAFIGTLSESKGAHLLLEALHEAAGLDAGIDIFGRAEDDGYGRRLRDLAARDSRVTLRGTFDNRAFATILQDIDLLVIPSLWNENSPLVLLQALALRCPVLVADVPGLASHVRPGQDGWTFRRGDANDLALQLRRRLADPAALAGIRAGRHAGSTLAPYIVELARLYEDIVAAHGGDA